MFLVTALYYVVYKNWAAFTAFDAGAAAWFKSVVFAIGGSLIDADKAIEDAIRGLAAGTVDPVTFTLDLGFFVYRFVSPELGAVAELLVIAGSASTLVIYTRFGMKLMRAKNPNTGIDEAIGYPLLLYAFAVLAVSAVQGSPRVPFQGVILLLQNVEVVGNVVNIALGGNGSANMTGNVSEAVNVSAVFSR